MLCGCASKANDDPLADVRSYADLNDPKYRIGVENGSVDGPIVEETIPKAQVLYFNSNMDLMTALEARKIDAITGDDMTWEYYNSQTGGKLRPLEGFLKPYEFGYIFGKTDEGRGLRDQLDVFLRKLKAEGTLDEIRNTWMGESGTKRFSKKELTRRFIHQIKILEMFIESTTFDFLGEGAEIDRYCSKHQIPPKTANRIRLAIEEMIQQILLPELDEPKVHVIVEYNEKTDKTVVRIRYNGPEFDPKTSSSNELSLSLFRSIISSFEHSVIREGGYTNQISFEQ